MYKLEVCYETSGSFGREIETQVLEGEWWDLDVVTRNMHILHEHYLSWRSSEARKPQFPYSHSVELKEDDGTARETRVTWAGYFESIIYIRVIHKLPEIIIRDDLVY